MIKNFLRKIYCFFESVGYSHAASVLAREGRYEEAATLMKLSRKDCN